MTTTTHLKVLRWRAWESLAGSLTSPIGRKTELAVRFGEFTAAGGDALTPEIPGVDVGAGRLRSRPYLDHQAARLAHRFDAGTYVTLTDAMSTHDVGRGRGG